MRQTVSSEQWTVVTVVVNNYEQRVNC